MAEHTDDCRAQTAIVLPSLDPDRKFTAVVSGLIESGFEHIVIIDDGSSEDNQHFFSEAAEYPQCSVIHHGVNKGKGRALKTAFEYISANLPDLKGAVTIDGDGQHLTDDIIACGNLMLEKGDNVVLGCRDFDLPNVPPRSVAGNKFTSKMFRLLFGIHLSDTQTGLRAIPAEFLKEFCKISGERFEYETNMLLQMKRSGIGFIEQPIETVYDEEDYSSHYNAVRDSWKVAKVMLKFLLSGSGAKYVFSSALAMAADYLIYYFLFRLFGAEKSYEAQLISTFASSILNFNVNKFFVFGAKGEYFKDMLEYYCVCIPRTLISVLCASTLIKALSVCAPGTAVVLRLVVDGVLFIACYYIQKLWVFGNNDSQTH